METTISPPVVQSSVAIADSRAAAGKPMHRARQLFQKIQSAIGLLALLLAAVILSPRARDGSIVFLQTGNLTDVVRQVSEVGIIALGMTLVILTGGIDLSVGSTLALTASVVAMVLVHPMNGIGLHAHMAVAMLIALAAAAGVGFTNGLIISRFRIQPFIATLATMIGIRGLARWLTGNTNIDIGFGQDVSAVFASLLEQKSVVIACFIALAMIFIVLLNRTVFGRYVRAVGDNERAAVYAGIPLARIKILVYLLCGLLAGIAGLLHAAQCHQGNPNDGVAYELEAIAAVVIGGTSLAGGRGTITGTIIGTMIMGVLTNLLRLKMVDSNMELMIKAGIIVLAVWAQSRRVAA